MIDILHKITRIFTTPSDPKARYFDSLKEMCEFQRAHPNYQGPLCMMLDTKSTEGKR